MSSVPTKKLILRISLRLVLIVAVLLCLGLIVPPLLGLFLPFLLAFVAATLLAPLVQKFAKRVGGWNFWSMLFVVLMLLAVTGILVYAGYYLVSQVTDLIRSWTSIREGITDMLNQVSQFLSNNVHFYLHRHRGVYSGPPPGRPQLAHRQNLHLGAHRRCRRQ